VYGWHYAFYQRYLVVRDGVVGDGVARDVVKRHVAIPDNVRL
tara:strand:- start:331 stop:456 length:126 start_codon:yes stop_codon:yes gene_type:complete